jgi:REP element-mobilizing transposase RayT
MAVRGRESLIQHSWEEDLYKYISGVVKHKGQKMIAINGMPDHIHFLIGMRPSCCLSDLIREIKKSSNEYINENKLSHFKFQWQEGFGAFSYGHSSLDHVIAYIHKQKEHHKKKTFKTEYKEILESFQLDYKDEFLFDWMEQIDG